jgi:hypothetical protein
VLFVVLALRHFLWPVFFLPLQCVLGGGAVFDFYPLLTCARVFVSMRRARARASKSSGAAAAGLSNALRSPSIWLLLEKQAHTHTYNLLCNL